MVGWIGTLLAKALINIASMSLSRGETGGNALSVLNLDSMPSPEVVREIEADPGILSVQVAQL
jgi:D-3-phosphoglycerate dehydrogenase